MAKEIDIQNQIRHTLPLHGYVVYRGNVGKVRLKDGRWFDTGLPKGFPDLFGFRKSDGKMFFIEVKNEKGKRSEQQIKFGEFLSRMPVLYGVARNVEEALEIVKEEN